jgi:hypothetical protein
MYFTGGRGAACIGELNLSDGPSLFLFLLSLINSLSSGDSSVIPATLTYSTQRPPATVLTEPFDTGCEQAVAFLRNFYLYSLSASSFAVQLRST